MSDSIRNPFKSWRAWALLALFIASFFFAWGNLFFWIGFIFFILSEPVCRSEMDKPVGPLMMLGGLLIPAIFLSFAAIRLCENPYWLIVSILGALGIAAAFIVWYDAYKKEHLKH